MQFAMKSTRDPLTSHTPWLRWLMAVVALLAAMPVNAQHAVLLNMTGLRGNNVVSGEVNVRLKIVGAPDLVLFELTGPVQITHARTGTTPSFMVDPQTGEPALWDTTTVPDGDYTLHITTVFADGRDRKDTRRFTIQNNLTNTEQNGSIQDVIAEDRDSSQPDADTRGSLPQVVVVGGGGSSAQGPETVHGTQQAADELPGVIFNDRPETYTRGSGRDLRLTTFGPMPEGGSLLAIAWSNAESRMVDAFAHTLDANNPKIESARLDLLPPGDTELQVLVRLSNQVHQIVRLRLDIIDPVPEVSGLPAVSFDQPPAEYVRGSGEGIRVSLEASLPDGADVLVLAWSHEDQAMVDSFGFVLGEDLMIPAASLDLLPDGVNQLQLLTRIDNQVRERVKHLIEVLPAAPPQPPAVTEFPAVGFASAPLAYRIGSGADVSLAVAGPMPEDGDIVVVAWSDSQQRMVEEFAFTIGHGDAALIPAERLDLLPLGPAQLQLLLRRDNHVQSIIAHQLEVEPETQVQLPAPEVVDLPAVAFGITPSVYTRGSGWPIPIYTTGGFPESADLLVIAWSVSQSRLVDAFAFTLNEGPFLIPADRLDLLPAGDVILQLLPRDDNEAYAQIVHRMTIAEPGAGSGSGGGTIDPGAGSGDGDDTDPGTNPEDPGNGGDDEPDGGDDANDSINFAFASGAPNSYTRGSGETLALAISASLPDGASVSLRAWSVGQTAYVPAFAHTISSSPWRVDAARLDLLAAGGYRIDATLIVPGQAAAHASHHLIVATPDVAGEDTDPQTPVAGFTAYARSADTRVIYVSEGGSDNNNGLTPENAVRTLEHAVTLIRDGRPDWLLLKRGDTFDLPLHEDGDFRYWDKSGRSFDEPMIVGAYGDSTRPRPRIHSNGRGVLRSVRQSHLVFRDLHFNANYRDPHGDDFDGGGDMETGLNISQTTDMRFEGCLIEYFSMNLMFREGSSSREPELENIVLHRCTIRNAYAHGQEDSSGMYLKLADGVTINECLFDHNGWDADVPQSVRRGRNHNVYFSDCTNLTITGNIFARESYLSLKIRSEQEEFCRNVVVTDNLFIECAFPLDLGANGSDDSINFVNVEVKDNVFVRTTGWPLDDPRGLNMKLTRSRNARVSGNLFVDNGPNGPDKNEACRVADSTAQEDVLVFENDAMLPIPDGQNLFSTHYRQQREHAGITFLNNRANADESLYVEASVTIEGYLQIIGVASVDALLDRFAGQDSTRWNTDIAAQGVVSYYRDGFQIVPFD